MKGKEQNAVREREINLGQTVGHLVSFMCVGNYFMHFIVFNGSRYKQTSGKFLWKECAMTPG